MYIGEFRIDRLANLLPIKKITGDDEKKMTSLRSCSLSGRALVSLLLIIIWQIYVNATLQYCSGSQTQEPSLGDVMIDDNKVVLVYYTDGTQEPVWAPICANTADRAVYDVICRQLGLQYHHSDGGTSSVEATTLKNTINRVKQGQHPSSSSPWYHHIFCGKEPTSYSHILQCKHNFTRQCGDTDNEVLKVSCENSTSQKYDGQLKLCHSDDFPVGRRSVSTGLVQIYLYKQLRGINQKTQRLQSHVADSICRQLGYTNAVLNSPVIVSITKQNYTNCYEGDSETAFAWFTTDQLHCDISQDCLGCCFEYPKDTGSYCETCEKTNDVVISCTFDPTMYNASQLPKVEERSKICALNNSGLSRHTCSRRTCSAQGMYPLETLLLSSIVPSAGLLLIIIILIVLLLTCYCRIRRQNNRINVVPDPAVEPILRNVDRPPDDNPVEPEVPPAVVPPPAAVVEHPAPEPPPPPPQPHEDVGPQGQPPGGP